MAKALFLMTIEKLDSERVEIPEFMREDMDDVIKELVMVFDFLRDKKLGEGTSLNYLIWDFLEIAQDALVINELKDILTFFPDIKYVRGLLREAKMRMLQFGVDGAEMRSENADGEGQDVVGLENDVELLHRLSFCKDKDLGTFLIKGISGIGKTTLARQLYNHVDIVDQFDRRAWVRVSSNLSRKEVLMKLIKQVVDSEEFERDSLLEKMERADNPSLRLMLHQHLQGMRYFIVLDDFPKNMHLKSILKALPLEDKGSRLLLTSLPHDIQATIDYCHEMKTLDPKMSWQLFIQTISFYDHHKFPKHLERKGRQMVTKCGGLPLIIKEMGRQLGKRRGSGSEWEELLESVDFGPALALLEPSYQKWDSEVKSCFLHLAFFKENTPVRAVKLTCIWVAGGIVPRDKIHSYLKKLVSECIIEDNGRGVFLGTGRYRINPILHMLSIKKAQEEIGFEILRNNGNNQISQRPRHRVIYCSRDKFDYSTNQDKHLHSLFFRGGGYFDASRPSYWMSLELLKMLDWEDFGLKILPESIGTLTELRYLGLRNNYIQELPHLLKRLKKLEVLDIAQNFLVEVPDIIWEMDSLTHLNMSDVIYRKPLKIDMLKNLESITYISVDNFTYNFLRWSKMTRLWELGIEEVDGCSDVRKLLGSLAKLEKLKSLCLRGSRFRSMPCLDEPGIILHRLFSLKLYGFLTRLPSAHNFLSKIQKLKLVDSRLDEDPMPVLAKLPWLKHLKLRNAYTGRQMVIWRDGFLWLRVFSIAELWNLRDVQVGKGAMPELEILEINNCPYLDTLPEEIGSMTYLKEFRMVVNENNLAELMKSPVMPKRLVVEKENSFV